MTVLCASINGARVCRNDRNTTFVIHTGRHWVVLTLCWLFSPFDGGVFTEFQFGLFRFEAHNSIQNGKCQIFHSIDFGTIQMRYY